MKGRSKIIWFTSAGLIIGFFGGFFLANSLNRSAMNRAVSLATQNDGQALTGALPIVIDAIERAKKEPDSFEAQFAAASMYYQIDRFEEAIKYYEAAHKLKPDDYQTLVRLGNSNYGLKRYEEASKWYEKALQINPNDVDVRTDYATTFFLRQQKDLDRAIQEYKIALQIKPNYEPTLQNLCVAYLEKGDKQSLKETLAKLEKVNPKNPAIERLKQGLNQ
ncbi:MAG: tetratricopeptide repeat protein [Pyrinomonadaceae bacterium]|nr:tetratricopeptide repeat protein [Pyrinomonadaceae bacterium]MCX7639345.1 tetratricopeptide repeat protein [Pyrinomonadaceae bacterium]MDW8305239.1 tetratricopeptide repeat protein [Acidobacteriota bacterium]